MLGLTLDTFGADFPLFLGLSLVAAVLAALFALVLVSGNVGATLLVATLTGIAAFAVTLPMIVAADALWTGPRPSFRQIVATGVRRLFPVIVTYLLLMLAVAAWIAAFALALSATPIAGVVVAIVGASVFIYGSLRLTPLAQVIVLEQLAGIAAIRRSWALTKGHAWRLVRLWILLGLALVPLSIGSDLLTSSTTLPGVTALAAGVTGLLTAPIYAIATTLAWAAMAGRHYPIDALPAQHRQRRMAFAMIVGLGVVLGVAGGIEGARTGLGIGGAGVVADRGILLTGASRNPLDPCRPGDLKTTFAVGEPVHLAGYFSHRLPPGRTGEVEIYANGNFVGTVPLEPGPFGAECYYEDRPITDLEAADWRIVIKDGTTTLAEGTFSVR